MKPLRILHVVLTPRHSGAEIVVGHLLRRQIAEGHALGVAALNPSDPRFAATVEGWREAGAELFIPSGPATSRLAQTVGRIGHLRRAFRAFRPDVVFAHSVIPSMYARLASRSDRIVTVLHSASQDDYGGGFHGRAERFLPPPHAVIGVTELGAANYRRHLSPRFPVVAIPNGIELREIQRAVAEDQSRLRGEILGEDGDRLVLQVGRISPVKRQHLSIRALARLREGGTRAVLALPGLVEDEPYQAKLEETVRELRLENAVRFLGSRSDVPDLLAASDLVLMPSREEAHSLALLEALACGRPVVASPIQAFEFAVEQPAYLSVDPEDVEAYAEAMAKGLASGSVERDVEAFSIERMAERYDELARRLITP